VSGTRTEAERWVRGSINLKRGIEKENKQVKSARYDDQRHSKQQREVGDRFMLREEYCLVLPDAKELCLGGRQTAKILPVLTLISWVERGGGRKRLGDLGYHLPAE